jgi:hypothetical protein
LNRIITDIAANSSTSQATIKGGSDTFQKFAGSALSFFALRHVSPLVTKGSGGAGLRIASMIGKKTREWGEKIGTGEVNRLVKEAILNDPELLKRLLTLPKTVQQAEESIKVFNTFLQSSSSRTAQDYQLTDQDKEISELIRK